METNNNGKIKAIAESFAFPGLRVTAEGSDVSVECLVDCIGGVSVKTATHQVLHARFLVGKAIAAALPERRFVRCKYGRHNAARTGFWNMGYYVTTSIVAGIREF